MRKREELDPETVQCVLKATQECLQIIDGANGGKVYGYPSLACRGMYCLTKVDPQNGLGISLTVKQGAVKELCERINNGDTSMFD